MRVFGGGAVSFVGCAFDGNTLFEDDSGAAIIQADGEVDKGGMQVSALHSRLGFLSEIEQRVLG